MPPRAEARPFTLSDRPGWRLLTLCGLYFAQGLPYGFMFITLAAVLAGEGRSPGQIGQLLAVATLPWAFKWIAGPIIDRFSVPSMGRRRPWILLAQCGMIVSLILLATGPDPLTSDRWLQWSLFAVSVCSALQDVAVDALAVDLLREEERGRVNGFMYGSSYMGNAVGGAGMGTVVATLGLRTGFIVIAITVALVMLLPLLLRERRSERFLPWTPGHASPQSPPQAESVGIVLWRLRRAFMLRSTVAMALMALLISIPNGFLTGFSTVLIVEDLGWGAEKMATWSGLATWAGLGGSIVGGLFADRFGARRMALIAGTVLGLSNVVFANCPSLWPVDAFIIGMMVIDACVSGVLYVSIFALCMQVSWPLVAATQFTAYMAMLNLSRTFGQMLTAQFEDHITMQGAYFLAGIMQIVPLACLVVIDPTQTRRCLGES